MPESDPNQGKSTFPLYARVLLGVILGALFGIFFGTNSIVGNVRNEDLGQLGLLVIRLLKALAVPLVLFAILDSFLRSPISGRSGLKLILICLVNVSVAFVIGLTIMNTFRPGERWRGRLEELTGVIHPDLAKSATVIKTAGEATLSPAQNIAGYIPESLFEPFVKNNIISIVLLGILGGAALRSVKRRNASAGEGIQVVERFIEGVYQTLVQMLDWVARAIPFAVFGVIAQVVGRSGLAVFGALWIFLVMILLGMALHSLLYYPFMAWIGGKSPRLFFKGGADAIITALSTNSSLATVPITLRCLVEKMGVSEEFARLSACVGTNLNNDGITLYEAMTVLFLAQACGINLSFGQQAIVVLASLMAGIGIAGIPEAGLVVLPLVLAAAGFPNSFILIAIPLVLPVDWIIGRARSAVNVMSDMLGAILLDCRFKFPR